VILCDIKVFNNQIWLNGLTVML